MTNDHLKMVPKTRLIGTGSYLPEKILTNAYFESILDTSDEWIVSRTGIAARRVAEPHEAASDMGAIAAKRAIEKAGIPAEKLDLILVATMTPDFLSPSTAVLIQRQLNLHAIPAFDISAACSGFLYALSVANAYLRAGLYKTILVVAAEKMSAFLDYTDRSTCVLFGDGAGAAILSTEGHGFALTSINIGAEGSGADLMQIPGGGSRYPASAETVARKMHTFQMQGNAVFKQAVRGMTHSIESLLARTGCAKESIHWIVPHQANQRIVEAMSQQLHIPSERFYCTLREYGNTSGSSIPIALDHLFSHTARVRHERIIVTSFGAGLTWGEALLENLEETVL